MNYEKIDLSDREKLEYLLKGTILSMAVSYLFYNNLWLGIPVAIVYALSIRRYEEKLIRERKEVLLTQFKDLLYSVSSSVSVGRSLPQALTESIDFWSGTYKESDYIISELRYMTSRINELNMDDVEVLQDFGERSGLDDIKNFALIYRNAKETGFNLVEAITQATALIQDKINLEKELKTALKEKEFESKVITYAPFVIMFFFRLTSKSYLKAFIGTPKGHIIATFALILMLVAKVMSERLVKIEV
ncbi:MAG: hypothetical protein MJ171_07660 [Clostridia bacterium]|nr:hypothetical protein [Clostridia bacterium]